MSSLRKRNPKKNGQKKSVPGPYGGLTGKGSNEECNDKNKWGRLNYTSPNFRVADKMMGRWGSLCWIPSFKWFVKEDIFIANREASFQEHGFVACDVDGIALASMVFANTLHKSGSSNTVVQPHGY